MAVNKNSKEVAIVNRLKDLLNVPSVMEQFNNSLGKNAGAFTASLVEILSSDTYLQKCDPKDIIMEALKAASLNLPINKALGFSWIIPRNIKGKLRPVFQIGYRGYYQLAQRTGLYRVINTRTVPAGTEVIEDFKTGEITFILPEVPVEGNPVGFFACFIQSNGFKKEMFKSYEWMCDHMRKIPGWDSEYSPWQTEFCQMGEKTVGARILDKYGVLSVEYVTTVKSVMEQLSASDEADQNQNRKDFDINPQEIDGDGVVVSDEEEKKSDLPEEFD